MKVKKKKSKKKKVQSDSSIPPAESVRALMKAYLKECEDLGIPVDQTIKKRMADMAELNQYIVKFIFQNERKVEDGVLTITRNESIQPLITAVRRTRYEFIKDLHIWGVQMNYYDIASLNGLLEKVFYPIRIVEMMECLLDVTCIEKFVTCAPLCVSLTTLNLDYNDFGDGGCQLICSGFEFSGTLLSLSMCFCEISTKSGICLANLVSGSTLQYLYLDGNDLGALGVTPMLTALVSQAESDAIEKVENFRMEELKRIEEERLRALASPSPTAAGLEGKENQSPKPPPRSRLGAKKEKPKKRKKKKGYLYSFRGLAKKPVLPPRKGPWLHKLHLSDNAIDNIDRSQLEDLNEFTLVLSRLVSVCECLQEVDLDDNLIGDVCANVLLNALKQRTSDKLPGLKMRVTHRIETETLQGFLKLGAGIKKKKRKRKAKKKK